MLGYVVAMEDVRASYGSLADEEHAYMHAAPWAFWVLDEVTGKLVEGCVREGTLGGLDTYQRVR